MDLLYIPIYSFSLKLPMFFLVLSNLCPQALCFVSIFYALCGQIGKAMQNLVLHYHLCSDTFPCPLVLLCDSWVSIHAMRVLLQIREKYL